MIEQLKQEDKTIIFNYLKEYFKSKCSELDPFEKIIVYKQDKILGFISYSIMYERAELNYILVLPDARNKGIASLLMEAMLYDLNENEVNNVTLEVREDNEAAVELYSKYGFQKVAIRKQYYGKIDALLMEKELGD